MMKRVREMSFFFNLIEGEKRRKRKASFNSRGKTNEKKRKTIEEEGIIDTEFIFKRQ